MLLPSVTAVAAVSVTQSLDRAEIPFEETATLTIQVTWDGPPSALLFDRALRIEADRLKVAAYASKVTSSGSGPTEVTTKTFVCTLQPTMSGRATVAPAMIDYLIWPDSIPGQLVTDAVSLTVAEPKPKATSDAAGNTIWIVLGVVVLGGGGALVALWAIRRRQPQPKRQTPIEAFVEGLEAIRTESGNDLKKFQAGLYRHIISYLSLRFQMNVNGRTTDAIVADLAATKLTESQRDAIAAWLTRAEREKYGPVQAAPGEVLRLTSEIRQFFEHMQ
jgi:hypothetical protein